MKNQIKKFITYLYNRYCKVEEYDPLILDNNLFKYSTLFYNNIAIDIHIRVNPELTVSNSHVIATQIETLIKKSYGEESFITVHIEPDNA